MSFGFLVHNITTRSFYHHKINFIYDNLTTMYYINIKYTNISIMGLEIE